MIRSLARRCLRQHGVAFDGSKTARTVTRGDYARFDRIICMDTGNLRWLRGHAHSFSIPVILASPFRGLYMVT